MGNAFRVLLIIAGAAVAIFALAYGSYSIYAYFAPKYRQVDRDVFLQSEQYQQGMIRDLQNFRLEWIDADSEKKLALRGTIIHRFIGFPQDKLTPDLKQFLDEVVRYNGVSQ